MTDIRKNFLIGLAIAAALAAGVYLVVTGKIPQGGTNPGSQVPTTTLNGVSGSGAYTVEPVGATPPSIDRPIQITASLSSDAQKTLRSLIEQQIAILRTEPTRVDIWLQLGVNRKIAGDYEGAIEAWEYVAQTAPKEISATAHGNLGDLYMYFLKDYPKAETRFLQAITLNPNVIEYYRALFYLYRDIDKDSTKAKAIVERGLTNNPDNADLLGLKAQL